MLRYLHIGGLTLRSYDTFFIAALAVFIVSFVVLRPERFPYTRIQLFWIGLGTVVVAVIGARLLHIALYLPLYADHLGRALLARSGFAYLGAPIAIGIFFWAVTAAGKIPFCTLADYFAPFLMLERFVGRIGCLLWGCCSGTVASVPWAWPFAGSAALHPTQAYELTGALALFFAARYLYRAAAIERGLVFSFVLFWYGLLRVGNDFFRADGFTRCGSFMLSQLTFSLMAAVAAAALIISIGRSERKIGTMRALGVASLRLFGWALVLATAFLGLIAAVPRPSL